MANIVYRQMPPCKSLDAKAPGWGQIFGANPRGCAGGEWLWMKLIPALKCHLGNLLTPVGDSRVNELIYKFA